MDIKSLLKNPIITGSIVMIVGTNFGSALNYLYHFILGRMLGPSSYGELAALFSVLVLLSIVPSSFGLVIIKFIAISKDNKEIYSLILLFRNIIFILGITILVFGSIFSNSVGDFLKIAQPQLFVLIIASFLIGNLAFVNKSALQGLVRFKQFVITGLFENSLKLLLGVLFVWIGWSVFGALIGLFIAYCGGWLMSWWFIREFKSVTNFSVKKLREVVYFTIPVIVQSVSTTSLFSADMILVKHYFSSHDAGIYAAVASLSKIVLFASGPVGAVMYPWIAKNKANNTSYWNIFYMSLILTILICGGILLFYFVAPLVAIKGLFGENYFAGGSILFTFGLSMSFLTVSMFLINFFLSVGRTWVVVLPSVAAVGQIIGINIWHDSLEAVVGVSLLVFGCLLMSLVCCFLFRRAEMSSKI